MLSSTPTTGIAGCCARTAIGHDAAEYSDELTTLHCQRLPGFRSKIDSIPPNTPGDRCTAGFQSGL